MTMTMPDNIMEGRSTTRNRRSNACRRCRTARVKCGIQQPRCGRCCRNNFECEYPDPLEMNFRSENTKAAVRAESQWRQRTSAKVEGRQNENPTHITSMSRIRDDLNTGSSNKINAETDEDIRSAALTAFFEDFGCTSNTRTPWLDFFRMLPDLYHQALDREAPIIHIILAVALAYLPRKGSYPQSEILARTEYCEAIRGINTQLQHQQEVPINELLASISLMGFFESITPDLTVDDDSYHPKKRLMHLRGAIAMVRLAEMQPHDKPRIDPRIVNIIYFQMVVSSLRNRMRPPLPIDIWKKHSHIPYPRRPGAHIFYLMYQVANWQADMDAAMLDSSFAMVQSQIRIRGIITTLQNADIGVLQWEAALPPKLYFCVRDSDEQGEEFPLSRNHALMEHPGAPSKIYTFASCWATTPRVLGFVLRLILHLNMVKCYTWMSQWQGQSEEDWLIQRQISQNVIIELIEHISSCINSLLMDSFAPLDGQSDKEREQENDVKEERSGKSMRFMGLTWPVSNAVEALQDEYVLQGVGQQRAEWLRRLLLNVHSEVGLRHPLLPDHPVAIRTDVGSCNINSELLGGAGAVPAVEPMPIESSSQDSVGDFW